jgi:acyl CoA:acetate/3-ketoacid CoA transferase beta subunit
VDHIITELAWIDVTSEGLVLKEIAPDTTIEQVQAVTEPKLIIPQSGPAKMPVAAR